MNKMTSMLLIATIIFTACEKESDIQPATKMIEVEPEQTGTVEMQFPNWEKQGIAHKALNNFWIQSDIELTLRYYGNDQLPSEKELNSEVLNLPLDSLTYEVRDRCNPDAKPWQVAKFNLEQKEGWYLIETKFLFSTGATELHEYNDTIEKCFSYNGESRNMIHIGNHEFCFSNDVDDYYSNY